MPKQSNAEIIDFVRKTTEAITVISESTKSLEQTTGAIKEMINAQNTTNAKSFENLDGKSDGLNVKMDGLTVMFKWVIVPLIVGILALAGVKTVFPNL